MNADFVDVSSNTLSKLGELAVVIKVRELGAGSYSAGHHRSTQSVPQLVQRAYLLQRCVNQILLAVKAGASFMPSTLRWDCVAHKVYYIAVTLIPAQPVANVGERFVQGPHSAGHYGSTQSVPQLVQRGFGLYFHSVSIATVRQPTMCGLVGPSVLLSLRHFGASSSCVPGAVAGSLSPERSVAASSRGHAGE